jgi:hypothetical protein
MQQHWLLAGSKPLEGDLQQQQLAPSLQQHEKSHYILGGQGW